MKAVVYTDYGSPDVLEIRDIKKPVPNDDQVLIKVQRGFHQSTRLALY